MVKANLLQIEYIDSLIEKSKGDEENFLSNTFQQQFYGKGNVVVHRKSKVSQSINYSNLIF